jgi:uncharacterized protein with HEPN domain
MRDDLVYIRHAIDAAEKICLFTKGKSRSDLDADEPLALALVRLLEIIGEAANCVSAELINNNPNVPWKKMIAMRNRLIHGYFDINYDIVWDTIINDIPRLIDLLKQLLNKSSG